MRDEVERLAGFDKGFVDLEKSWQVVFEKNMRLAPKMSSLLR